MPTETVLALVGGGHAHVEVIRRFCAEPIPDTRLVVFDPNPKAIYSGMVPGFVAGNYQRHELEIDLEKLCEHPQVEFVARAAHSLDAAAQQLHFDGSASIHYDVASLDIGSTVAGADLPGVREFALASRPISDLVANIEKLFARPTREGAATASIYVVGAGAGGVELAFCLEARLRREAAAAFEVQLVTSDTCILGGAAPALRDRVERALARRGIQTLLETPVAGVIENGIELEGGRSVASATTLWVTGPAAHSLALDSGLPIDPRGFARITPTFRVVNCDNLFAVGDCASLPEMKKAGVYAVRAGPLLDHNLRAHLSGERLRDYAPQSDFLSLLNLGDGTAIGAKWGIALEGRALMHLKDRIDRAFVRKYQ